MDTVYYLCRHQSKILMVSASHVSSATLNCWDQKTEDMSSGSLCCRGANSKLQPSLYTAAILRISVHNDRKHYTSPEPGKQMRNCLTETSHKIGRQMRNGLVKASHNIVPCSREDYRAYLQDLSQIVVEPGYVAYVEKFKVPRILWQNYSPTPTTRMKVP